MIFHFSSFIEDFLAQPVSSIVSASFSYFLQEKIRDLWEVPVFIRVFLGL